MLQLPQGVKIMEKKSEYNPRGEIFSDISGRGPGG